MSSLRFNYCSDDILRSYGVKLCRLYIYLPAPKGNKMDWGRVNGEVKRLFVLCTSTCSETGRIVIAAQRYWNFEGRGGYQDFSREASVVCTRRWKTVEQCWRMFSSLLSSSFHPLDAILRGFYAVPIYISRYFCFSDSFFSSFVFLRLACGEIPFSQTLLF